VKTNRHCLNIVQKTVYSSIKNKENETENVDYLTSKGFNCHLVVELWEIHVKIQFYLDDTRIYLPIIELNFEDWFAQPMTSLVPRLLSTVFVKSAPLCTVKNN